MENIPESTPVPTASLQQNEAESAPSSIFSKQHQSMLPTYQPPAEQLNHTKTFVFGDQAAKDQYSTNLNAILCSSNVPSLLESEVEHEKRSKKYRPNLGLHEEVLLLGSKMVDLERMVMKSIMSQNDRILSLETEMHELKNRSKENEDTSALLTKAGISNIASTVENMQRFLEESEFPTLNQAVLPTTSWAKKLFKHEQETGTAPVIQHKPQLDMLNSIAFDLEDRDRRKHCIIAFGVQESKSTDLKSIKEHDGKLVKQILSTLGFESNACTGLYRFVKKVSDQRPSPLRITLAKDFDREDVLKEAHRLRNTEFSNVFLKPDRTAAEQHEHKQKRALIVQENEKLKLSGEHLTHRVIIVGNTLKKVELRPDQQEKNQSQRTHQHDPTQTTQQDNPDQEITPKSSNVQNSTTTNANPVQIVKNNLFTNPVKLFKKPEAPKDQPDQTSDNGAIKCRSRSNSRTTLKRRSESIDKSLSREENKQADNICRKDEGELKPRKRGPKPKKMDKEVNAKGAICSKNILKSDNKKDETDYLQKSNAFALLASMPPNGVNGKSQSSVMNTEDEAMAH